ncbi:MAG: class B sortase [Lachnospiraceae bacterium]|nr:class B sortase [Lachnospiraceae bacterium]
MKNKKLIYDLMLAAGILILIAAGIYFYFFYKDYENANAEYDSIAREYTQKPVTSEVTEEDDEAYEGDIKSEDDIEELIEEEEKTFSEDTDYFGGNISKTMLKKSKTTEWYDMLRVDVQRLKYSYKNAQGWIFFEKGEISYPVVRGEDNEYYLEHTLYGNESKAGAIFMDYRNTESFDDERVVIYGHNMRNYSMFGYLRFYKKDGYYDDNKYFQIFYDDKIYRYQVFSYFDIDATDVDMVACDFEEDARQELMTKALEEADAKETDTKEINDKKSKKKKGSEDKKNEEITLDEEEVKKLAKQKFLEKCKTLAWRNSKIPGLTFNEDSHIISLVTCSATGRRLMVNAVRVDEHEL